jgi:hypothetical protein
VGFFKMGQVEGCLTAGGVTTYLNAVKTDTQPHAVVQDSIIVSVNTAWQIEIRF